MAAETELEVSMSPITFFKKMVFPMLKDLLSIKPIPFSNVANYISLLVSQETYSCSMGPEKLDI